MNKPVTIAASLIMASGAFGLGTMYHPAHSVASTAPSSPVQRYVSPEGVTAQTPHVDSYQAHSIPGVFALDIPECEQEDSHDCIWLADKSGNGVGESFIDYHGHVYYIDHDYDYAY